MKIFKRMACALLIGLGCAYSANAADEFTIYYDDSDSNFGSVNIYYWVQSDFEWPGVAMTKVQGNIWSYTFPSDPSGLSGFLFCNSGGNNQTADMSGAPKNGHLYKGYGSKGSVSDMGEYNGSSDPGQDPGVNPGQDPNPGGGQGSSQNDPAGSLNTDYYKVNPNGQFGSNRTVNMTFNNQNSTTALTNWTADDMIAQGVARDVCMAIKGKHERPVIDSYALYAAYDDQNLYLGAQFVYTVWDAYGEGKQPGESKPYNMDGRMMWAFDLNPEKQFDGYINGTGAIWNDGGQPGAKFNNGVDAVWIGSSKPGVGTPGFFTPTPDGHASYDAAYCKGMQGSYYGYADGLLPSIEHIYGQGKFEYNPSVLEGNEGFVDIKDEIAESAHTFYEWRFPLSTLGITADYIRNTGIGVMYIDVYGSSPVGGTPYDPSYFDNVKSSYSMDPSTSMEKEDEDVITYACARIGKASEYSAVSNAADLNSFNVSAAKGMINVNVANANVIVADMTGKVMFNGNVQNSLNLSVNSGLYIVNVNGKSAKVVVK